MASKLVPIAVSSQLDVSGEERIHAAGYNSIIRPTWAPIPPSIFVGMDSSSLLLRSQDYGASWPATVDSGGSAVGTSALYLAGAGGRLTRYTPTLARTTIDGSTFVDCTGIGSGFPYWGIYTGEAWLLQTALGIRRSTDGIGYSSVSALTGSSTLQNYVARLGDIILCNGSANSNAAIRSTDKGLTWAAVTGGGPSRATCIVATNTRFLMFTGGSAACSYSTTGATGSWLAGGPMSIPFPARTAAYDAVNNRVLVITSGGSVHASDDEGTTWSQLGYLPYTVMDAFRNNNLLYTGTNFIHIGSTNTSLSKICTTVNGSSWTETYSTSTGLTCVVMPDG